ncbi:MAG: hypothetical protein RLY86_2010 [Pseudomonadota bacterium]|jgi:Fe(3+) dicitrate transport protein
MKGPLIRSALPLTALLIATTAPGPLLAQTVSAATNPAATNPAPAPSTAAPPNAARESMPEIVVIGSRSALPRIPGSASLIDADELRRSQVHDINEALRKVPGILPREEEGAGLRPNIGLRGLNPTRSTKTLLLEDGIPLTFAPYGDNASYFHPSVERYERIEVLKGSGQIAFGPNTVGGVINYITPNPPEELSGQVQLRAGNRDFREGIVTIGGTEGATGAILNAVRKETDGSRDNMRFRVNDISAKVVHTLTEDQALTLKFSWYDEDSDIPYSGLTAAEYAADPRFNPFVNDTFKTQRAGISLLHRYDLTDATTLTTALYGAWFDRDWWRQSSNSSQRPNDSSDPACAGMANLLTTCGNEGRLREYHTAGIEPRLTSRFTLGSVENELQAGLRYHIEDQDRRQWNGDRPNSRTPGTGVNGGVREDNRREAQAWSGFIQNRIGAGAFALTPGVRVEHVEYERENRMNGTIGRTDVTEVIPGLGASVEAATGVTLYAGVHRGFAPPRVEDIISATGGSVDLDSEKSWNYEAGVRAAPVDGLSVEASVFRMEFDNQIIPASVAGGVGATLTSAGETLHQGLEAAVKADSRGLFDTRTHHVTLSMAWTWVEDASFKGNRFSTVGGFTNVRVTSNRLPYAPEHLLTTAIGYSHEAGIEAQVEMVYTGSMFTDDLNTVPVAANGQRGRIDEHVLVNIAASYSIPATDMTLLGTVKNVFDRTYVTDRSRGTIPGNPRTFQVGLRYAF